MKPAGLDKARDTGLALTLVCLLVAFLGNRPRLVPLAIILLLLAMLWPKAFGPLARLWFGLAHVLGKITSSIILTLIFYGLVIPVGSLRRWLGADPLQLQQWKKGRDSAYKTGPGKISPEDLDKPF